MKPSIIVMLMLLIALPARADTTSGNGVERGSIDFTTGVNIISANVRELALHTIASNCRLRDKITTFTLVTLIQDNPSSIWLTAGTTYRLKFKVKYENTWHNDWIEMSINEPIKFGTQSNPVFLPPVLESLYSVTGACNTFLNFEKDRNHQY